MTSSYLMISPDGRFYDNCIAEHKYSDSILSVGIKKALKQINYDHSRFIER